MDSDFLFLPAYNTQASINTFFRYIYKQPDTSKNYLNRSVEVLFNAGLAVVEKIVLLVGTAVTGAFSLITYPHRIHLRNQEQELKQLLSHEEVAVCREEIVNHLNYHSDCKNLTVEEKDKYLPDLLAYSVLSKTVYGPIVRTWTENLLDKANREGRKLVFMARDGIPPYKIARELMAKPEYQQKYPNMVNPEMISVAYLSRKVIKNATSSPQNREMFKEYVKNEVGIKPGDSCYFVDVGYEGSMIKGIRELIAENDVEGTPKTQIDFEYLISITPNANGFLATNDNKLSSVPYAGGNKAIHWLEDAHLGTRESPTSLVRGADGHVYPNSLVENRRCAERDSLPFLVKKFAQRFVVKTHNDLPLTADKLEAAKSKFDLTLAKLSNGTIPLIIAHV